MVEGILFLIMALSLVGMATFGFTDPLSKRFWDQWK